MLRKAVSGITLTLLIASMLTLAFNIQFAKTSDSLSVGVSPKTGPPGTMVRAMVQNPQPRPDDESVRLIFYFNNVIVGNYTYSVRFSSWSTAFRVPDIEPGKYTIKVLLVDSNATGTATFTVLPAPPPPKAGVMAGDWIKYDYAVTGWPAGQPYPLWLKVEFLSVAETNATIQATMHMSDGTEQNATVPVDVMAGGQALGLSGFIIPANYTAGYSINMGGAGFTFPVTIAGETTRTYAGASRTVIYASFSQYGTYLTYYWDKQTGVMVEASTISGSTTGTAKATETNMWQAAPGFPIDPIILSVLIAIVIVIVIAIFLVRRKKKPAEAQGPET
ncbi:MAG: hypothetical protein QMD13_02405 [Candidatus Bathyarchaeia archaeon]|nr:hypothetical protein [Candidatus Bathyarchaeia archaeon]